MQNRERSDRVAFKRVNDPDMFDMLQLVEGFRELEQDRSSGRLRVETNSTRRGRYAPGSAFVDPPKFGRTLVEIVS